MAILPLRTYPDPVLSTPAAAVEVFDSDLGSLIENMFQTMYHDNGVGLAANQVGVLQRVAVIDVSRDLSEKFEIVNPAISWRQGTCSSEEGCLSVPGYHETIKRSKEIVLQARDRTGREFEIKADGLLAICIQHEIDHLDGKLFIDRMSRLKREFFKRWHKKQTEQTDSAP